MKLAINKTAFIRIDVVWQKYTFQIETVHVIYIFCSRFSEMEAINLSAPGWKQGHDGKYAIYTQAKLP